MKRIQRFTFFCLAILVFISCNNEPLEKTGDNFDRSGMLVNWAGNIIIPAYEAYVESLETLLLKSQSFRDAPGELGFDELRNAWLEAYQLWQRVSMFDIGKAETLSLRNYTNIYPTDSEAIINNIETGNYNLNLPSNFDAQGFPALDYLLYGLGENKNEIISLLSQDAYGQYLNDLLERLHHMGTEVLSDWKNTFRDTFISNTASSATGSISKVVNDYLFYFERFLRAGKIGIPAGVFSGSPISSGVEAPYAGGISKELFMIALGAFQDFFNGKYYDSNTYGPSLGAYLDYLNTSKDNRNLKEVINGQLDSARNKASQLLPDFQQQIIEDNDKMLETYDELQKVVVLLKVDMLQALNIQVDFVDADGD